MHPNPVFEWAHRDEMLRFLDEHSFAHIFTANSGKLGVAHAPVLVDQGKVQFHLARRNRIAGLLAGQQVLISVVGRHAYQSANWYVSKNQVPTWHYEAVEVEGSAREMGSEELTNFLDRLSEKNERRVQPDNPWSRTKMEPGRFEAMMQAIVGFEVEPEAIRGTRKFNQHKNVADLQATIEGQLGSKRDDIAAAVRDLSSRP